LTGTEKSTIVLFLGVIELPEKRIVGIKEKELEVFGIVK
jgi:hypothetical protein